MRFFLSFVGIITACVEENGGGFYCFLTDFFFFHYKLSVPAVVGDALVAAGVFWGALVTVGWLEVMLGVVGGEHWRAVLLVMRGQWTCNKHIG